MSIFPRRPDGPEGRRSKYNEDDQHGFMMVNPYAEEMAKAYVIQMLRLRDEFRKREFEVAPYTHDPVSQIYPIHAGSSYEMPPESQEEGPIKYSCPTFNEDMYTTRDRASFVCHIDVDDAPMYSTSIRCSCGLMHISRLSTVKAQDLQEQGVKFERIKIGDDSYRGPDTFATFDDLESTRTMTVEQFSTNLWRVIGEA